MTRTLSKDEIFEFLRDRISARISVAKNQITGQSVLLSLGVESIDAVLICGEIEDTFEVEMNPSMIFEYESLDEFVDAIIRKAGQA